MLIETRKLNKTFQRGGHTVEAVKDLDFSVERGDFVHIVGRSGSGKTTLLNLISGLLQPDQGEITVAGRKVHMLQGNEPADYRNDVIGYIPQRAVLLETLTALENILLPYYFKRRDGDGEGRARYLLAELGVKDLADAYPGQLSGGELRRIQIARALINDPEILIADEPTGDLDIDSTSDLMQLLQKLNEEGLTLLIVTHELDALSYGKSVYTMEAGSIRDGLQLGKQ